MQIIRTFVPDSTQNYNHLVYCPTTRQAAAIDPYDAAHLLRIAEHNELDIRQIWITHEHGDHIKDLDKLKALTNAPVLAPVTCKGRFNADTWLPHDSSVALGGGVLQHWLTPGHTPGHGVFVFQSEAHPEQDFIVCGDTLFNAGVGNTYSGDTNQLYHTVCSLIARLSTSTRLFPGHDYLPTNLKFVLSHFPQCTAAEQTLKEVAQQSPDQRSIKTLAEELQYNPFFSLDAPWLIQHDRYTGLNKQQTFLRLRSLRDQW